jgi:hypothetical protein
VPPARVALALAALLVAGCAKPPAEFAAPLDDRYRPPEGASAECVAAAKRASHFCPPLDKGLWVDQSYALGCNQARWDYARECR